MFCFVLFERPFEDCLKTCLRFVGNKSFRAFLCKCFVLFERPFEDSMKTCLRFVENNFFKVFLCKCFFFLKDRLKIVWKHVSDLLKTNLSKLFCVNVLIRVNQLFCCFGKTNVWNFDCQKTDCLKTSLRLVKKNKSYCVKKYFLCKFLFSSPNFLNVKDIYAFKHYTLFQENESVKQKMSMIHIVWKSSLPFFFFA